MLSDDDQGFRLRACRDGEGCLWPGPGGGGGRRRGWGGDVKWKKKGGCRIIFSERFETLHGLKLKWMWDRILCNDPEDRMKGLREGQTGTETNLETREGGRQAGGGRLHPGQYSPPLPLWEVMVGGGGGPPTQPLRHGQGHTHHPTHFHPRNLLMLSCDALHPSAQQSLPQPPKHVAWEVFLSWLSTLAC